MIVVAFAFTLVTAAVIVALLTPPGHDPVDWPDNTAFAFAIMDDTDGATTAKLEPFYNLLDELGIRATKTVWPLASAPDASGSDRGLSLEDAAYAEFVKELQARGFEIAYHGARGGSSSREDVETALNRFREVIGHDPKVCSAHSLNRDNLYWGEKRFSFGASRFAYRLLNRRRAAFTGDDESAPEFWGDLARERVRYFRNLSFHEINTLRFNPTMPYFDPAKPFANAWFAATEAQDAAAFVRLVTPANLDRLEAEGGACLLYIHSAFGFVKDGEVVPEVRRALEDLAARNGWFAPTGEVLDYLAEQRSSPAPTPGRRERLFLEARWFWERLTR